jgi:hypothetical protein
MRVCKDIVARQRNAACAYSLLYQRSLVVSTVHMDCHNDGSRRLATTVTRAWSSDDQGADHHDTWAVQRTAAAAATAAPGAGPAPSAAPAASAGGGVGGVSGGALAAVVAAAGRAGRRAGSDCTCFLRCVAQTYVTKLHGICVNTQTCSISTAFTT